LRTAFFKLSNEFLVLCSVRWFSTSGNELKDNVPAFFLRPRWSSCMGSMGVPEVSVLSS
jgi:hypothetical protein